MTCECSTEVGEAEWTVSLGSLDECCVATAGGVAATESVPEVSGTVLTWARDMVTCEGSSHDSAGCVEYCDFCELSTNGSVVWYGIDVV